ncbi:hypothetical protein MMC29_003318, partial [Sticta canariensis]|nr:hypothetical protein [Sticta canariensis]
MWTAKCSLDLSADSYVTAAGNRSCGLRTESQMVQPRAGQQFFQELDADGDGRVVQADVARVLRKRNLPESYAKDFISAARGGRWWSTSVTWEQFRALVDERESKVLRAYTSLHVNDAGQLDSATIKGTHLSSLALHSHFALGSLSKMGLEATDRNTGALMKALGADEDGFVSYGNFRNFVMLLPEKRLQSLDPSLLWFNAASSIPFGPPPDESAPKGKGRGFLVAAMAGAIASGSSTLVLHPIDTLKTRLQSSTSATLASVARSARESGA